ncbi:MAG: glycosyltransferase family 4 protein [Phycisphaeraceae bacterium]|nr:glycosyltransferase family 4 protein [Phycisphaeraceae bacterium]
MRIGLDARTIYWPTRRGTGKNLIDLYAHVATTQPDWEVRAYHRLSQPLDEDLLPQSNIIDQYMDMPGDRFDCWERLRLPYAAWKDQVDVLHCPANTCPRFFPVPTMVTIHDLIPLDMPQGQSQQRVNHFRKSISRASKRASWIITPSLYTRNRLVSEFGADPHRITINPWAADSNMQYMTAVEAAPTLLRYAIDRPYVIHFGASALRKNTKRVVEAWAMLTHQVRKNWQLVIVGLDEKTKLKVRQQVENLGIGSNVNLNGFVPEEDIAALLSGAEILAFPSLSEGFGLPILDAFKAQAAVLTSDVTSLPEVAGKAAILVNPENSISISAGMTKLIKDRCLRFELVQMGTQRLKQYNWQATTQRFIQAAQQASGIIHTQQTTALRKAA